MRKQIIGITLRAGGYIILPGIIAWLTGKPFIFPSLGPTAYLLAFDYKKTHSARVVIGGHICGVAAGLISYWLIADPHTMVQISGALSSSGWYLSAGSAAALALTTILMLSFNVSHPPACATTLIISLGILPGWDDGLYIILAVGLMYGIYWLHRMWLKEPV
ncbi:MAG: HPP family protein [Balneolaceae bacterium]